MKKVLLASILATVLLSFVGCSAENEADGVVAARSIVMEDASSQSNNSIDQRKALKLYNKYLPKVISILENKGLTIRNLNENKEDTTMVSRIVVDNTNDLEENSESMWFGVVYDDENLIKEVGMYIEYPLDFNNVNGDLNLKNTLLQDIENLFFKNESFLDDVTSTIKTYDINNISEVITYGYKKGNVEIGIGHDKVTIKINLTLREKK